MVDGRCTDDAIGVVDVLVVTDRARPRRFRRGRHRRGYRKRRRGRKVVLRAGVIERINLDCGKVEVRLTKEQIKNSPEFDPDTEEYRSDAYRERVGTFYAEFYS
jgi:hypothetical protein